MPVSNAGDAFVLTTVNAPYRRSIDGDTLAKCLRSGDAGDWTVHVATLFVDVRPGLVARFARNHGVDLARLIQTYREVRDKTGERSPAFEAAIPTMEELPEAGCELGSPDGTVHGDRGTKRRPGVETPVTDGWTEDQRRRFELALDLLASEVGRRTAALNRLPADDMERRARLRGERTRILRLRDDLKVDDERRLAAILARNLDEALRDEPD